MDHARLTFLGTADAFNGAGRGNACYWVDDPLGSYVVDFGPTAVMQCLRHGCDPGALDVVYITHLHGDHLGGLAQLLLYLQFQVRRSRPLVVAGPPGLAGRLALLRDAAFPKLVRDGLPFSTVMATYQVPGQVEVAGRQVRAIRARHDRFAVAASLRIEAAGRALVFSGDTGWQPSLADLARDADAFVCECSEVEEAYWGHTSLAEIRAQRGTVRARRMVLSHLSGSSRTAAEAEAASLDVVIADDGLRLDL